MLKFTENFSMTFAENRTYGVPEFAGKLKGRLGYLHNHHDTMVGDKTQPQTIWSSAFIWTKSAQLMWASIPDIIGHPTKIINSLASLYKHKKNRKFAAYSKTETKHYLKLLLHLDHGNLLSWSMTNVFYRSWHCFYYMHHGKFLFFLQHGKFLLHWAVANIVYASWKL